MRRVASKHGSAQIPTELDNASVRIAELAPHCGIDIPSHPIPAPLPPVNFASERIAAAQVVKDIADVWATSILYVPPVPFLDAVNREIHAVATDAHTMAVAAKAAADSAQEAAEEAESMARQCTSTGTAAGGAREVGRAARFGPHDGCHQFVACFRFSWTETFRLISTWSRSPAKYCYCALHPGSI